jgi:hypothetical protein
MKQESIAQTIARIEKQKGRSLTTQELFILINHEVAHMQTTYNCACDYLINADLEATL